MRIENQQYCPESCLHLEKGICRLSCADTSKPPCPLEKMVIREAIIALGGEPKSDTATKHKKLQPKR